MKIAAFHKTENVLNCGETSKLKKRQANRTVHGRSYTHII